MKTLHTDKTAEIILTIPVEESPKLTEALTSFLRLAGHEIKPEEEIDDNKLYTIKEAFPDFCPAKVLRGFRLTFELDQTELAEKLGIKQSHVSDMETGKRPISRKMAAKLSKVFDIPAKAFITV